MRSHRRNFAAALIMVLLVGLLGASPAAAADLETVVASMATESVYIEEGSVPGDAAQLDAAVTKAKADDVDLYIAVLADDTSGVKAKAILEGVAAGREVTVLLFSPTVYDFESSEICPPRFDEASANADTAITTQNPDVAANAFVDELLALPDEVCESTDSDAATGGWPWWLWLLLFVAAIALVWFLASIAKAIGRSRRRERDEIEFDDRRRILKEWAGTLRAPITELQAPVAQARSSSLASMFNDALKVARESDGELERATTLPELDRAEIRIARAQMQVRDVRKALDR